MAFDSYISTGDALGAKRIVELAALSPLVEALNRLIADAAFIDVDSNIIPPLKAVELQRAANQSADANWACIGFTDGTYLCVDEVRSTVARDKPVEAVLFPQLHMQLVSWWLLHAWRFTELVDGCLLNLNYWNLNTAAILSRALIEEVGCLLYETRTIHSNWSTAKSLPRDDRPLQVRRILHPLLLQFKLGSRGLDLPGIKPAINVLTYVQKLAKELGSASLEEDYSWLSDAAHPAIGSRICTEVSR